MSSSASSKEDEETNLWLMVGYESLVCTWKPRSSYDILIVVGQGTWLVVISCHFVLKSKVYVTCGDNNKRMILDRGDIGDNASIVIQNVLYVDSLKHSFLSISYLYDKGHKITF